MTPYYQDDMVTLYHGDCRETTEWLITDVLVTDPPYGIRWSRHGGGRKAIGRGNRGVRHAGIAGDGDTSSRDHALAMWGDRPAVLFGSFYASQPAGVRHVAAYLKPRNSGVLGSTIGLRRDIEPIYLVGSWPTQPARRSSLFATHRVAGAPGPHPHAKPIDVMEPLLRMCPPGVVADPFAGSGSTLIAARNLGRRAVGVEIEERYCAAIARRLQQDVLPLESL